MAMYHMSIKIASRATGRSAVAAAAYRSCSKIENERDGLVHDYTRKHGLVAEGVVLPDCAPERFADRSTLWNEVEAIERSGNAQLAREFEVALPHDLSAWQRVELTLALCHGLASEGMVCDWAIHDADGDNHNVHAHILCPMRSCDENGFLAKAVTAYTVRLDGIEAEMTAAELKDARARGDEWEKVYTYRLGNERRQLAPSEAEEWSGAKRQGKDPVKAKRELNDWNNPENAERWRKGWADLQNGFLAKAESEARVDHRSYARRGVERVAARHEGPYINKIEKESEARATREGVAYEPVTDRRRENIAIAALNRAMAVMRRRADAVARAIDAARDRAAVWFHKKTDALTARRASFIKRHESIARVRAARAESGKVSAEVGKRIAEVFAKPSENHFNELQRRLAEAGVSMRYNADKTDFVFERHGSKVTATEAGRPLPDLIKASVAANRRTVTSEELRARARAAMADRQPAKPQAPRTITVEVDDLSQSHKKHL